MVLLLNNIIRLNLHKTYFTKKTFQVAIKVKRFTRIQVTSEVLLRRLVQLLPRVRDPGELQGQRGLVIHVTKSLVFVYFRFLQLNSR